MKSAPTTFLTGTKRGSGRRRGMEARNNTVRLKSGYWGEGIFEFCDSERRCCFRLVRLVKLFDESDESVSFDPNGPVPKLHLTRAGGNGIWPLVVPGQKKYHLGFCVHGSDSDGNVTNLNPDKT